MNCLGRVAGLPRSAHSPPNFVRQQEDVSVGLDRKIAFTAGVWGLIAVWLPVRTRATSVKRSAADADLGARSSRSSAGGSVGADVSPCECPEAFHELGVHRPGYEPPDSALPYPDAKDRA